jgi:predicted permease
VAVVVVGFALLASVLAIVDGVLFKSLGYQDERQLAAMEVLSTESRVRPGLDRDDLAAWAETVPEVAFTGIAVLGGSVGVAVVQPNFFDVIGVQPVLGGFRFEDFERATSPIEPRILTDEVYRSRYGGDSAAIGRIEITDPSGGYGYRIVGVMPRGFVFPSDRLPVGYIAPYAHTRYAPYLLSRVIARIPESITADELQTRVLNAATTMNAVRASRTSVIGRVPIDRVDIQPLGRALGSDVRPLFASLLSAACLLAAIGGLNASSLMAARAVDRRHELGVRRALGASQFEIARILMVEAALLVGVGAACGLLISHLVLRFVTALLPGNLVLFRTAALDWRVAAFTLAAAAALTVVVAAWPVLAVRRGDVTPGHSRSLTGSMRSVHRRFVVAVQIALALVLTILGSLLVGSLLAVYAQAPPIATTNVLAIGVHFFGTSPIQDRLAPDTYRRVDALVDRVRKVPGVDAVALTAFDLLDNAYVRARFTPPRTALNPRQGVMMQAVTADFYRMIGPELVAGRWPTASELANDDPVILVSERVASNYWPSAPAVGESLTDQGPAGEAARTFTVVGMVKDVRWRAWDEEALPTIYGPHALLARQSSSYLLVRTAAGASSVAAEVRRVLSDTDAWLNIVRVAPLDDLFVDSVRPRRFRAWLFGSFAVASLGVLGIGILGQLAMSTAQRTREVGIRMACGAVRGSVVWLILREQLVPVLLGIVVGGIGAAWTVQVVSRYLYQVTEFDALLWGAAIGLILLTAAAGTLIPALRASRINPVEALRVE